MKSDDILIDTQVLIWYYEGNKKLSSTHRKQIDDINNRVFISAASIWEIYVKVSIGKLDLIKDLEDFLIEYNFNKIELKFAHFNRLLQLPHYHRDPFDRLIISTAIAENYPVITYDSIFSTYEELILL